MSAFYVLFFLASLPFATSITKRQIWYAHVNCVQTHNGPMCEAPKTVITPHTVHNQALPWYPERQQSPTDAILASPNPAINPNIRHCRLEQFQCSFPVQCIEAAKVCDGEVHCVDGSDEKECSCIKRLHPSRICDNYFDCPDGIDEVGCFGCENDSYSCYYNEDEFMANSGKPKCYDDTKKCNIVAECSNAKDESDCLLLSSKKTLNPDPFLRSTDGYLYILSSNKWFPVCVDHYNWTRAVCMMEQGVELSNEPTTSYEPATFNDQYYSSAKLLYGGTVRQIIDNCSRPGVESANAILHVKCPDVCGKPAQFENKVHKEMRIAGGKEATPGSHPWLVSLHLNGSFICGGSIIERKWILTAAHCLVGKRNKILTQYDYMDIRAGIIRQNSFTPHEQAVRVLRIIVHNGFDLKTFSSDIALLELAHPLRYNRYVQPICLPPLETIISDSGTNWMETYGNMTCLVVGWGGFTFRGPSPIDNLMEVVLPIVRDCDPTNPTVFCAGYVEGGYDTCYGDSGSPFVCTSDNNRTNFFLAGVTSYGYNPTVKDQNDVRCGEPNSYTAFVRMTMFSAYIEQMKTYENSSVYLREKCPGRRCRSNRRCVQAVDGVVDCLDGEDETT